MARRWATLVVAGLCVLAGCGGFDAQGDVGVDETVTPAPVPSVPEAPAEGVSEHAVDAPTVASNHRAALEDRSYTSRTEIRWREANGSTYVDTTVHRVAAGGREFHVTADYGERRNAQNLTGHELWSDGNQTLLRLVEASGGEEYRHLDGSQHVDYPRARMINALFAHLEPSDVRVTSNGATVVRGSLEDPDKFPGLHRFRDEDNATMSARITPDGYVDRLAIGFDATVRGTPVSVRMTIDFSDVGSTTVSEPAWTENASRHSPTPTG